jgi:hypothetical protein
MTSNGGFPPIKYCKKKLEELQMKEKKFQKERYFNPNISSNINIRKILKDSSSKPIIDLDKKEENIDIINEL